MAAMERSGEGKGDVGRSPVLSRRSFCAIALSTAAGLSPASSVAPESPEIGRPARPHVWEYAYVYAYE